MNSSDYSQLFSNLNRETPITSEDIKEKVNTFKDVSKETLNIIGGGLLENTLENTIRKVVAQGKSVTESAVKDGLNNMKEKVGNTLSDLSDNISSKLPSSMSDIITHPSVNESVDAVQKATARENYFDTADSEGDLLTQLTNANTISTTRTFQNGLSDVGDGNANPFSEPVNLYRQTQSTTESSISDMATNLQSQVAESADTGSELTSTLSKGLKVAKDISEGATDFEEFGGEEAAEAGGPIGEAVGGAIALAGIIGSAFIHSHKSVVQPLGKFTNYSVGVGA